MPSGVILLAEDDEKMRRMYSDFLRFHGFSVVTVVNGVEAIDMLRDLRPSLVLLDIMMPVQDGIETCRQAREIVGPDLPILFLTASDDLDTLQKCMEAGGDDYLIKSGRLDDVLQRVTYWASSFARKDTKQRRTNAVNAVKKAVETAASDVQPDTDVSSATNAKVRKMSRFVMAARSGVPTAFGRTPEQKILLLGYLVGVVDHWSDGERDSRSRYFRYLQAVLEESGVLASEEIPLLLEAFDDLSSEGAFKTARLRSRHDCVAAEDQGLDFVPTGLAQLAKFVTAYAPGLPPSRDVEQGACIPACRCPASEIFDKGSDSRATVALDHRNVAPALRINPDLRAFASFHSPAWLTRLLACITLTCKGKERSMRITSKGQVTIPADIRAEAGLLPHTEVEFIFDGKTVRIRRLRQSKARESRGALAVARLRGRATVRMTTEEILALTRSA